MQTIQAIHQLSVVYPGAYFGSVIVLLLIVCAGWFKLGSLAIAGPARRRIIVSWRPHPFSHSVLVQIAGVRVLGSLESDVDYVAASVAVRIQL